MPPSLFYPTHFGAERNCTALGRTLYIKGVPFTVVGVVARNFSGIEDRATDIWIPLRKRPELNAWGNEGANYYAGPKWWCLRLKDRRESRREPPTPCKRAQPTLRACTMNLSGALPM